MKTSETGVGYNGRHDHPTTSQTQRCGRFGSTLCYPCSRCLPCFNSNGSTKRSRACLCMYRACRLHARANLPDELPVQLSQCCRGLLPQRPTCTQKQECLLHGRRSITQPTACLCISRACLRAIAPQDNVRVNRGVKKC